MSTYNGLFVRTFTLALLASGMFLLLQNFEIAGAKSPQTKSEKIKGDVVFQQYCASCHQDGGNVTAPSKPVADSKKLSTLAVFKDYLNNPVGHMPYYKNIIDDEATLKSLYQYCKTLHKSNVKAVSYTDRQIHK